MILCVELPQLQYIDLSEIVLVVKAVATVTGVHLRGSLCKILISSFAHKMDFAHNFSVDFFQ